MGRGSIWMPLAAATCVLGLGGTAWVPHGQSDVRERLARFVAERDAQQAEPRRREALYGETVDGNACDDYVAASKVLTPLRLGMRHVNNTRHQEWVQRDLPLTEEARRSLAPALDLALEHVRRGVRRSTLRFPEPRSVATFELETTVDDAMDRAYAAGDGRALAELFVDCWVLTGDLWPQEMPRPPFRNEWLLALDAETALWFDAVLCRLDERVPVFVSARDDLANTVREVADLTPLQESFTMGLSAWRFGFDWFWRELVFSDRLVANLHELEPPAQDWPERQAQISVFVRVVDDGRDARIAGRMLSRERCLRTRLTDLRFLRLAIGFVHGLELPQLADPLGAGLIEVDVRGDEATFRSEGMDGKKRLERTVRRR